MSRGDAAKYVAEPCGALRPGAGRDSVTPGLPASGVA
jgi:hypothetical protein